MVDAERAFARFHTKQCEKCGIPHRATDFRDALKELDGTFVATRKIQESVLVRFQNPSIRDFMQNALLEGEVLADVIACCVFFEQAHWFMETLNDKESQLPRGGVAAHVSEIVGALQRLMHADSCSFSVEGHQAWQRVTPQRGNPARRLATIAEAISSDDGSKDTLWVREKIAELTRSLVAETLSPSACVGPVETLWRLGLLKSDEGKEFVVALKARAMSEPSDLDDFETLASLIETLAESFDEAELTTVRRAYAGFAERYSVECELTNPDELREEASRLGNVGGLIKVDTEAAQTALKDTADEIERTEGSGWDDDDDRRGGGDPEQCSDGELDSMFGTLGN